jgi:hypothetical protein
VKRTASVVLLLGLLAMVLPASAGAKNLQSATICGASGCHKAIHRGASKALAEEALAKGGGPMVPPPSHGAPWYRVLATVAGEGAHARLRLAIVPSLRLIRGYDGASGQFNWMSMTALGEGAYSRLTRGLDPFPASSLRGVANSGAENAGAPRSHRDPPSPSLSGGAVDSGGGPPIWAWTLIGAAALAVGLGAGWRWRRRT